MDLKNIDLKNIKIEDLKEKILQLADKKTLIKIGISTGAIIIFLIIYFLILRPQQKRVKAHKEMIDALKKGDTVITQGGLIGKISKITSDQEVEIEIAKDVRVKVVRGMISDIRKWLSNGD